MCGYKRRVLSSVARSIKDIDLAALDARLAQLQMLSLNNNIIIIKYLYSANILKVQKRFTEVTLKILKTLLKY